MSSSVCTILHVDINSYFATLLQQENPKLQGVPLGVSKSEGRTCMIAVSKEAKQFGAKTGMRLKEARQCCPQLQVIPASFERYLDATRRLKKVFTQFSPHIFVYSLDEVFVDISSCLRYLYPSPLEAGKAIQAAIAAELGDWVTASVGIGANRLQAKIASEIAGTNEILEITENNLDSVLAQIEFKDVCGIGFRLAAKLAKYGIYHPYQLRFLSYSDLEAILGKHWAKEVLKIAYGQETHLLSLVERPPEHMQSVGRSITGYQLCDDDAEIEAIIYNLISEATAKARQMGLQGNRVSISLYGRDEWWGWAQTLDYYLDDPDQMFKVLLEPLRNWQRSFAVIKYAIRLTQLRPSHSIPVSLYSYNHKRHQTLAAVDSINQKYGLFTLRPAKLLKTSLIRPEVTGFLGDRQYLGL